MNNKKYGIFLMLLIAVVLFSSCSGMAPTLIEMELTQDYDTSDPFINEKLIYVSDDIDELKLNVSFRMTGEYGRLEIADNETGQVYWSEVWEKDVDKTDFTVSLDNLEKEKEYVIRFTGTKITYTKITVTSENSLVKERERPQKSSQN